VNPSLVAQNHFLKTIVERKRVEVEHAKQKHSLVSLRERVQTEQPSGGFQKPFLSGFVCIAEIKKKSPSRGLLAQDFVPEQIAEEYERGGAAALSVLTDSEFFGGSLDDIVRVKRVATLPVLRKDFIIDEYQIYEARAYGADAILLISEILSEEEIGGFVALAKKFGMAAIVESHSADGIEKAKRAGAQIIGVNNRNLDSFAVDFQTSFVLKPQIPDQVIAISESGIKTSADLQRLIDVGYRGALIGETLMLQKDREQALRNLLSPLKER
jgi:indole-3-glycerol phosphate synthase